MSPDIGAHVTFTLKAVSFVGDIALQAGLPLSEPLGILPQDPAILGGYALDFLQFGPHDANITANPFLFTPSPPASGAPEPSAWTMMILGLGGGGAMLRHTRGHRQQDTAPARKPVA